MKRFFACLAFVVAALAAAAGMHPQGDEACGAQGMLYDYTAVGGSGCSVEESMEHAVAYAENGTFTQPVTSTNHSPRSGFPTVLIGSNIPSPSFNGRSIDLRDGITIERPYQVHAKLYVLRV